MKKQKTNPVKILLMLGAGAALAGAISGLFYRPAPDLSLGWPLRPLAWAGLLFLAFGLLLLRYWRKAVRQPWKLWALMSMIALTSAAVQQTGGLQSFLLPSYFLLILLSIYRAEARWQLLAPAAALMTELGSAWFNHLLRAQIYGAAAFAVLVAAAYLLGRLMLKRSLSAAGPVEDAAEEPRAEEAPDQQAELQPDLLSLVSLAHASLGSRTTAFFRLEPTGNFLKMTAWRSYSAEVIKNATLEASKGVLGWVVKERQTLLYSLFQKDSKELGYYQSSEKTGSFLAVPVLLENRVEGILLADSDNQNHFNENSKLLLQGFAVELARLINLHQKHSALGIEGERLRHWNHYLEQMANRLKVSQVVEIMGQLIPELIPCDHLVLLEVPPSGFNCKVLLADPAAAYPPPDQNIDISGTLCQQALDHREWRMVEDFYRRSVGLQRFSKDERPDHGFRSVLAAPLLYEGVCHYLLILESKRPYVFEAEADNETLHIITGQFALALRSAALYEEKEQMAIRDGLTGLANHRRFQEYLTETLNKSGDKPVAMALFDIDFFKKLNDNYGHPIGDAVLKEVASRLKANISQYDFVARYGGEEFVAVWPGKTDKEAEALAEGLRKAIEGQKFKTTAGDLPVTISLGVAAYPQDSGNKPDLIKSADEALYAAKKAGRNRVVRFGSMNKEPAKQ
jgi:diguanylate cyclase (GGDEF)-like protein